MLDALREVVLVWRKELRASICKKQIQLDRGKRMGFVVSAAASGACLKAAPSTTGTKGKPIASLSGFMLNFGLSGGMNPAGTILATQRWWDIAMCLQALHVEWGFAVGCRRPLGTDIGEIIPGFPFAVVGHESVDYDAVSVLCLPSCIHLCQWLPQFSKSTRTCWVLLGSSELWSCVYVPPFHADRLQERLDVIRQYFQEWDLAHQHYSNLRKQKGAKIFFHGCGDLNMHEDIQHVFEQQLAIRGLCWSLPNDAATHINGGTLDFFWQEQNSIVSKPVLHDGIQCRQSGCSLDACGQLSTMFGSKDLDHYPWTFTSSLVEAAPVQPAFCVKFVKDPDAWSAAVRIHGEAIFQFVGFDLSTAMQMRCLFPVANISSCRQILGSCAMVWEVAMTLIGYCAGLVTVRPVQRTPRTPRKVQSSFFSLIHWLKVSNKQQPDCAASLALLDARDEYRQAVRTLQSETRSFRTRRYLKLCSQKTSEAEIFLAKCLKKNQQGLPDYMHDDAGHWLCGQDILDGAAKYIQDLQQINHCADILHRAHVESECQEVRSMMRSRVDRSLWVPTLSEDDVHKVLKQLDLSAECRGLPYAALTVGSPMHSRWVFLMHKLAVVLGVSTSLWTKQDLYHSLKPGRSPQSFLSFRVIGLTCAHGRLQEELIHELEPDLWAHTGFFQEGRSQCLVVVAADLCVASLRLAQQLPYGICFCDRKEAFDTQWRASMMVKLASCLNPRLWCVADDLLTTTSLSVVKGGARSKWFSTTTGVVEGRKLSPVEFCIGQSVLDEVAAENMWGLGVDPPPDAVAAYHQYKNGSTSAPYNFLATHSLLNLAQSGSLSWDDVMRAAPDDTMRLALLDASSTLRRGVRSFVDDTRVPVGCHGHAKAAFQVLESVAAREQYLYKPGKNFVVANGFSCRMPIPLQGSVVEYKDDAVQLGCAVDSRFDGTAHLQHILSRGPRKLHQLLGELVNLGLPFAALRTSMQTRMLPASTFGLELVVHVPGFEKKLNALQAFWFRTALGCVSVPRVVLMHEFGVRDRLSALAWIRAISLRRRAAVDPRYGQEDAIMTKAEEEPTSWSATVAAQIELLQIPAVSVELRSIDLLPGQRKAKLRHHVHNVVQPSVRKWEDQQWRLNQSNQQHWENFSVTAWTLADLDAQEVSILAGQAWAQLKLQGFFTSNGFGPRPSCSLCQQDEIEHIEHLFFTCPAAHRLIGDLLDRADVITKFHVGSNLPDAAAVLPWISAAWKLQRSRDI